MRGVRSSDHCLTQSRFFQHQLCSTICKFILVKGIWAKTGEIGSNKAPIPQFSNATGAVIYTEKSMING